MTGTLDDTAEAGPPEGPAGAGDDPVAARRKAMNLLAQREYSRKELAGRLAQAGFHPDITAASLAALEAEGLLDDARFAESLVRARAGKGQGPVRIRQELRERGIDAGLADGALADAGQDWVGLARSVRCKKFGESIPARFGDRARQMRFLAYRGFSSDQIRQAIESDR